MLKRKTRYTLRNLILALTLLLGTAGLSGAASFYLDAQTFTKTMPDGTVVTMWGYANCSAGFAACDPPTAPGPTLIVPSGDSTVNITVRNSLTGLYTEPTSLMIPGQQTIMGSVPDPVTGRVRSFTQEVAVGENLTYTWNSFKAGTYLYQTATHPGLQVQMGLIGAIKKDSASGQAYTGVNYNTDAVLVFSEIDPALHDAIATNNYGPGKAVTSTFSYVPKYFLINGEPFTYSRSATVVGNPGEITLLRFLNAGINDYTPLLQGLYMSAIAEDGNLVPFPKQQYTVNLPAGKTVDATIAAPAVPGYYPLYDRKLNLTNAQSGPGGMLIFLNFAGPQSTLNVTISGSGTVRATGAPGGIDCGADCTESYNTGTVVGLTAFPDTGFVFNGWTGVDPGTESIPFTTVTMDANKTVTASFIVPGTPTNFLTLKRPNSGKVKKSKPKPYKIKWKFTVDPGPYIRIDLFQNDQFLVNIAAAAPAGTPNKKGKGKGVYLWTVDPTIPDGTDYKVRIVSTTNSTFTDFSNKTFKIVP
jgi:uncharacterized repeat protein (TIGR02543 family)